MKFKNVGSHAQDIASGQSLEVGDETSKVNPDDPHDAALIEEGVLLELEEPKAPAKQQAQKSSPEKKEDD